MLYAEVKALADRFGLEHLGFLTLTFPRPIFEVKKANKKFNSLLTNCLRPHYICGVIDLERHLSGGIHYHLVVASEKDVRTGFEFPIYKLIQREIESGVRKSFKAAEVGASPALVDEWRYLRGRLYRYGFGRSEFLPVESNAEGIARYVGKYISKHVENRKAEDKGARLVRYFGYRPGQRVASPSFQWANDNSWLWRQKLGMWCTRRGLSYEDVAELYGPKWCWLLQHEILAMPLEGLSFPSEAARNRSRVLEDPMLVARCRAEAALKDKVFDKTYELKPIKRYEKAKK